MSTLPLVINSLRLASVQPRVWKLVALSYAIKTAAFGVAWYFVPDLPQRLWGGARAALAWLAP